MKIHWSNYKFSETTEIKTESDDKPNLGSSSGTYLIKLFLLIYTICHRNVNWSVCQWLEFISFSIILKK